MEKNKLLTIAIPTYNRQQKLKSQVHRVLSQLTEEVKLVIIDNCSDYNIYSLFSDEDKHNMTIIRNDYNIGGDANIAKCFEVCDTEWLWTLSDDDVISDDAVSCILSDIKKSSNVIFLNYNGKNTLKLNGFDNFCKGVGNYQKFFWMSVCVYNHLMLKPYLYYYHSLISTMQPGVLLIMYTLLNNSNLSVVEKSDTIIIEGGKDIHWDVCSFIYSSLYALDILKYQMRVINAPIIHSITSMLYYLIRKENKQKGLFISFAMIIDIVQRRGCANTLRYDFPSLLKTITKIIIDKCKA